MKLNRNFLVGLLIGLAILLLIILTYVIPILLQKPAEKQPFKVPIHTPAAPQSDTDILIKPFHRTITRSGQTELEISARQARINQEEKLFVLNDIGNITFYGKNGLKTVISADEGTWKQSDQQVFLKGHIKCKIEQEGKDPVRIDCQWMSYVSDKKIIDGGGRVHIVYGPYRSEGDSIAINMEIDLVTLDGRVISDIRPEAFKDTKVRFNEGIRITARRMRYHHSRTFLEYTGNPIITSGNNMLRTGYLSFEFGTEKRLRARQGVVLKLAPQPSEKGPEAPLKITASELELDMKAGDILLLGGVQAKQPDTSLSAEEIRLQLDSEAKSVINCSAYGEILFHKGDISAMANQAVYDPLENQIILSGNAHVSSQNKNKLNAEFIRLFIDRHYYLAQQNVHLEYRQYDETVTPAPQPTQPASTNRIANVFSGISRGDTLIIDCQSAELDEITGTAHLVENVRGSKGDYRFSADAVDILFDPAARIMKHLKATGHLQLSQNQKILTGEQLNYDMETGKAIVTGHPLFWEGPNRIKADQFIYTESPSIIEMNGHVDMVLQVNPRTPSAAADAKSNIIHISADHGRYNESDGTGDFKDNVTVDQGLWNITGDEMHLIMDKSTGDIKTATMTGNVHINHELFEATGGSLTYSIEDSIIILTRSDAEKCKVWKNKRGSLGDRIKFYVNENRFVIEKGMSVVMPNEVMGSKP